MATPNWGTLQKSSVDAEVIEDAVGRLIGAHEADPTAHLGAGESLQAHKNDSVIDHPADSVVEDKIPTGAITSDKLTTDLIVGKSFATAETGTRIIMDTENSIRFYVGEDATPHVIVGTDDSNDGLLYINNPEASGDSGIVIYNDNGYGIELQQNNDAGIAITIRHYNDYSVLDILDASDHTAGNGAGIYYKKTATGAGGIIKIRNEGTGIPINIENNIGTIGSEHAIYIQHYGSGNAITIGGGDMNLGGNRLKNLKTKAGAFSASELGDYGLGYDTDNDDLYFNKGGTVKKVHFT